MPWSVSIWTAGIWSALPSSKVSETVVSAAAGAAQIAAMIAAAAATLPGVSRVSRCTSSASRLHLEPHLHGLRDRGAIGWCERNADLHGQLALSPEELLAGLAGANHQSH